MPAYNAAHLLPLVLTPLLAMRAAGEIDEILVVDDRSTDDTAAAARAMGATVLVTPQNGGPGVARNLASEQAMGEILWFVDSDVIAQPGGAALIRRAFAEPGVDAVFGSYDDDPGGTYWFSRYKNLLHRYHHQAARREVRTFWAGCGAVRAAAFRKVAGFDVETYRKPSIEDIELGYRITRAGGRILVEPDLLGKHLKVWTLRNAIHTDIYRRALPWARLMITREGLGDELNTGWPERARALVALMLLLSLPALLIWPQALAGDAAAGPGGGAGQLGSGAVLLSQRRSGLRGGIAALSPALLCLFGLGLCLVPVRIPCPGQKRPPACPLVPPTPRRSWPPCPAGRRVSTPGRAASGRRHRV